MKSRIISIGDELLIGQVVNTNSSWMAEQLNLNGIGVKEIITVSDDGEHIKKTLEDSLAYDLVFITGGLGPTKDDITKEIFAEFFESKFIQDDEVLKDVTDIFSKRGLPMLEENRKQALVPENCFVIRNKNGTAPGMWMKKKNTVFVSMPGVPYEMKAMMSDVVIPKIRKEYDLPFIYHKTVLTQGVGESFLADKIEQWENALAEKKIKLAYLPQPGMVRLRLSTEGPDMDSLKRIVNDQIEKLSKLIPDAIFGYEDFGGEKESLEKIISEWLREKKCTIALAESCTGGYLASLFTAIPGASDIFKGAVIPYTNQAKHELLQVENEIFQRHGAVSEECVQALVKAVRQRFHSDYAIAVSGIAGPGGGTNEKPVGTVWIAVAHHSKIISKKFVFGNNRQRNIQMSANAALKLLLDSFR